MQTDFCMEEQQCLSSVTAKMFQLYIDNRDRFVMLRHNGSIFIPKYKDRCLRICETNVIRHLRHQYAISVFASEVGSKFICFDVDDGGTDMAKQVMGALVQFGIPKEKIHISSSGRKGYHVEVFFDGLVPENVLRAFYAHITLLAGASQKQVEFLPTVKQAAKLPLSIHPHTDNICWYLDRETLTPIESAAYILGIEPMTMDAFMALAGELPATEEIKAPADVKAGDWRTAFKPLDERGTRHERMVSMAIYLRHHGADYQASYDLIEEWYNNQPTHLIQSTREEVLRDIQEIVSWAQEKHPIAYGDGLIVLSRREMHHIVGHALRAERLVLFMLYIRAKAKIPMTHEKMVEVTGLCRQTISATLKQLAADGEIKVIPGKAKKTRQGFYCRKCCQYKVTKKVVSKDVANAWPTTRSFITLDVKNIEHDFMAVYGRAIYEMFGEMELHGRLHKKELVAYEAAMHDGDDVNQSLGLSEDEVVKANANADMQTTNSAEDMFIEANIQEPEMRAHSGLQSFRNSVFGELNLMMVDGKPLFPASKCAKILGYEFYPRR